MTNPKTNSQWEVKLRLLLNDFLQDIDTMGELPTDTANALVDIHLRKFNFLLLLKLESILTDAINEIKEGEDDT